MIYLDNAATSYPKPKQVISEVQRCMRNYCANPGRSGHKMSVASSEKVYECRQNICSLFNIDNPQCVSFTDNATGALNLGIKGILKSGDHVVTTSMEHNSVTRPINKLKECGVEVSVVQADKNGEITTEDILENLQSNTKLVVVTHASNVVGALTPVKEIGSALKQRNIIFMVDAAQTAGVYPIDATAMNIDILAFPGHKGLLGPQGTGGVYIREGLVLDTLKEGGTGSLSELAVQPEVTPDRYESGTLNTPGIAGLNEGIKYILNRSVEEIAYHECRLKRYMLEGLCDLKNIKLYGRFQNSVGVVSLNVGDKDCEEVCASLNDQYNIAARGGLHCSYCAHKTIGTANRGTVRFGIGVFNTRRDIEMTLKALKKISK